MRFQQVRINVSYLVSYFDHQTDPNLTA